MVYSLRESLRTWGVGAVLEGFGNQNRPEGSSRASPPVDGVEGMNQELEQQIHLFFVSDDKVDVPVLEMKCYAFPRIKWERGLLDALFPRHAIDMLPE